MRNDAMPRVAMQLGPELQVRQCPANLPPTYFSSRKRLTISARPRPRDGFKVDFIGFVLVALGLGCLEVVLDEGQRSDWFS